MDEYIKQAIKKQTDIFGFSDHAPMNFDKKYRMKISDMINYENNIDNLREKYKNQIKILKAYEVDFIYNFIENAVINADVDYLIGSVHFLDSWGFDNPEFIAEYKNKDIDTIYDNYFLAVKNMVKTGYFNIVGHFDLIKVFNYRPKKDIKKIAIETIKEIKKSNMAVEINLAGFKKPIKEQYPSKEILELCLEFDIPICFGSDAHKIEDIGYNYNKTKELVKKIGFTKEVYFENKEMIFVKI
jgi:histidinol-phosphatase (PHP family)